MNESKHQLLLARIIAGITHKPVRYEIEWSGTRRQNIIVYLHPDDMGIVMGKEGKCIKSIQSIALAWAAHANMERINVILRCPDRDRPRVRAVPKNTWDENEAIDLICAVINEMGLPIHHMRVTDLGGCIGLVVQPALQEPLLTAVHTVFEIYGKSFGKKFGLASE